MYYGLKTMKFPAVLIAKEKYATRYFLLESKEDVFAVSLKLVRERWMDHYWYCKPDTIDEGELFKTYMGFSFEEFKHLPESLLIKYEIARKLENFKRYYQKEVEADEYYENAKKAVDTNDGRLAWKVLQYFGEGEYQGFTIEPIEPIEDNT